MFAFDEMEDLVNVDEHVPTMLFPPSDEEHHSNSVPTRLNDPMITMTNRKRETKPVAFPFGKW